MIQSPNIISSCIEYKTVLPYARLAVKKTATFSLPIFIKVDYINQVIHEFMYLVLFIVVVTVRLCGDML